jgi:tight adherence protein C
MISWLSANPMALWGALALLVLSAVLVRKAARFNRDRAVARLGLIEPWSHLRPARQDKQLDTGDAAVRGTGLTHGEREIARSLARFGIPGRAAPHFLHALQGFAVLAFGLAAWFLLPHAGAVASLPSLHIALSAGAAILGWFLPVVLAEWAARRHAAAVVSGLPDALELLVICAEGGLALGDALDRVVTQLRRPQRALAEELAMTAADLKILPSQEQALAHLARRIDAPIVHSIVTALSQSMRYGTPFAQAMRTAAAEIRNESLIRLEERANKLPTLLTVAMIVLIMPTIFIVIMGPAALQVMDQLGR